MAVEDRLSEFDFNAGQITEGDYVLISTKEGQPISDRFYGKYDSYTVWLFDTENLCLYYIHNNI
ncbi:MAG: hypothetical protein IKP40_02855 [Clostridia bacterium]|nr:hypothetical protein [Clostridia bacterium]